MNRRLAIAVGLVAVAALAVVSLTGRGESQGASATLVVAMYAPTEGFTTSAERLQYIQGLARAIEGKVEGKVEGRVYSSLSQLRKSKPDFAIVPGQCYASNRGWTLLANAQIRGSTERSWALYSSVGPSMQALRGQKLAFVQTGCRDGDFVENAMLESEVGMSFFSGRVGKSDINGAVAEVASYKGAQAVFAPVGMQKGLTKVFDTGDVANPAFVQINQSVNDRVASSVRSAVVGYGGGGAIDGWAGADERPFRSLAGRMGKRIKRGEFADPTPVRIDARDVLVPPSTLDETELPSVRQHFDRPPERQP